MMAENQEQGSSTGDKIDTYFRKLKPMEERNKEPILPRELTSPPPWEDQPITSNFPGYKGVSPGLTKSRKASQSTYDSNQEYEVDQTVYHEPKDIDQFM